MREWSFGLVFTFAASLAFADEGDGKFIVAGETLTYDTETVDVSDEMEDDDVDVFLKLLQDNSGITTLVLNSGGGSVWAGDEMARIALDFELDTVVRGECNSACVNIFLAGQNRRMARGSKIGFHSRSWAPDAMQSYYEKWREDEGWTSPFEFGSWVYRDTQAETYNDISYIISRGVDAQFAVKIKEPREDMWYPRRSQLTAAGVLTE